MKSIKQYFKIRKTVLLPSVVLFYSFIGMFFIDRQCILENLDNAQNILLDWFGSFFQTGVLIIVVFSSYLYLGPLRHIKIGGKDARPILSKYEWFYITLCTITAAGLLFWSCCEPLYHIHDASLKLAKNFPGSDPDTVVLGVMFLHWTFVPFCIYLVPSIALALTIVNPSRPLSFGSVFSLFLNRPCPKGISNLVDAGCLLSLIAGISASLAVGVLMLASAVENIFSIRETPVVYFIICFLTVFSFTYSATCGLLKGIRRVSFFNTKLFYLLGLFVLIFGPTTYIISKGFYSLGFYFENFFDLTLFSRQIFPDLWIKKWTLLHWGAWLSWAPVTGIFLARLAYGYTVKQMIEIQVILPGLFTCAWVAIFSGSALYFNHDYAAILLNILEQKGPPAVLFHIFSRFPGSSLTHIALFLTIIISFVTAADSNLEAVSSLCLQPKEEIDSPTSRCLKVFWGSSIGVISWIMVTYTGIDGMRIANCLGGLPSLVLILFCIGGLVKLSFHKHSKHR